MMKSVARREALPLATAAVGAVVIAVGLAVHAATGRLGTALPPFVSSFGVVANAPAAAIAALVLVAGVVATPRLLHRRVSPPAFAATLFALGLALGLSLSAARHGTADWSRVFRTGPGGSFEAKNEYLPALPAAAPGIHYLLDRFALLVPALPPNPSGHPPGLLVVMHLARIDTAARLAALCIGCAAALPPLAYALGRAATGSDRTARLGALLTAFCPVILLFGFTSPDAVFAALAIGAAAPLASPRPVVRAAGACVFAISSLFSWALLSVGVWASLFAWRRDGARPALAVAAGCAFAVVAFQAALAVVYGYDPLAELRATHVVYRQSLAHIRPYWFWVLGSPVAWLAMIGLPIALWWLRAVQRGRGLGLALAAVVVASALGGFTKAETERIWLPYAPLACVAAAPLVTERRLRPALGLLAAQALAWQLMFATIW
jgi:hypothetical protein